MAFHQSVCDTGQGGPDGLLSLEFAEKTMGFYNRYFSIKYPFGKLDIVCRA